MHLSTRTFLDFRHSSVTRLQPSERCVERAFRAILSRCPRRGQPKYSWDCLLKGSHLKPRTLVCRSRDSDRVDGETSGDTSEIPDSFPVETDWREFRAKLVLSESQQQQGREDAGPAGPKPRTELGDGVWAHPITQPEKGCLLLAHPLMFQDNQKYFAQAVILLVEHGEAGSMGSF
eukprot:jgi/Botrbrau1/16937/Bobra.49_2s0006.1